MHRREFLFVSGLGASGALLGCATPGSRSPKSVFARLLEQNDEQVDRLLQRQTVGPKHPSNGGLPDARGIYHPGAASGLLRAGAVAWTSTASRHHRSDELASRMLLAARFLRRVQHADGTIDLLTTNFHSTPDTGFVMEWVCLARGLLRDDTLTGLQRELDAFIEKAAGALSVGGIHTPNHRWVVCMALARANALLPDQRYVARIDEWLGEGVDIDPDGQFAERSTSVYSPLTDRCLITVARLLDRPQLLEPVRRNLEMTLYYLHADGEVVTEASRRQDQYRKGSLAPYYYPYRYMAQRDGNGRFAAVARWVEATSLDRLTRDAAFFAESEALRGRLPAGEPLPTTYEKHFAHSSLVRVRRGLMSATLLADNPTFFSLHRGDAAVVVRFATAFFGKGQFVGSGLRKLDDGGWIMHQDLTGPYWQPLEPARRTGQNDWAKTDRTTRRASEVQRLRYVVTLRENDGAFELEISIDGTARVPVAIELGFRKGGELSGHGLVKMQQDGAWILEAGTATYATRASRLTVGPGTRAHTWTGLRGALPKLDADCVYLTGFTPFGTTLRFT